MLHNTVNLSICTWKHTLSTSVSPLSCIGLSFPLSSCLDEAHEIASASPSQRGPPVASRALQKALVANTSSRQSQTHRGGYHRLCSKYDGASSAGHVQQDRKSRCSPGSAKPCFDATGVGHSSCAWEVSLDCTWCSVSLGYICWQLP